MGDQPSRLTSPPSLLNLRNPLPPRDPRAASLRARRKDQPSRLTSPPSLLNLRNPLPPRAPRAASFRALVIVTMILMWTHDCMSKDSSEYSTSTESFPSGHRMNLGLQKRTTAIQIDIVFIFGILLLICNNSCTTCSTL